MDFAQPLLWALFGCTPAAPETPRVDELAWLKTLQAQRPEALETEARGVYDPGWRALVLHPRHRARFLDEEVSLDLLVRDATPEEQQRERVWRVALRAAHRAANPTDGVRPSVLNDAFYVGYRVGEPTTFDDDAGYTYKIYLSVASPDHHLSAAGLAGFAQALAAAGVDAAFKVDLRPGLARHTYNQVILYLDGTAEPFAAARCVEAVAHDHYGAALSTVGRGVDPPIEPRTDWHHFLLTGGFDALPEPVKDWVQTAEPPATDPSLCHRPPRRRDR